MFFDFGNDWMSHRLQGWYLVTLASFVRPGVLMSYLFEQRYGLCIWEQ